MVYSWATIVCLFEDVDQKVQSLAFTIYAVLLKPAVVPVLWKRSRRMLQKNR